MNVNIQRMLSLFLLATILGTNAAPASMPTTTNNETLRNSTGMLIKNNDQQRFSILGNLFGTNVASTNMADKKNKTNPTSGVFSIINNSSHSSFSVLNGIFGSHSNSNNMAANSKNKTIPTFHVFSNSHNNSQPSFSILSNIFGTNSGVTNMADNTKNKTIPSFTIFPVHNSTQQNFSILSNIFGTNSVTTNMAANTKNKTIPHSSVVPVKISPQQILPILSNIFGTNAAQTNMAVVSKNKTVPSTSFWPVKINAQQLLPSIKPYLGNNKQFLVIALPIHTKNQLKPSASSGDKLNNFVFFPFHLYRPNSRLPVTQAGIAHTNLPNNYLNRGIFESLMSALNISNYLPLEINVPDLYNNVTTWFSNIPFINRWQQAQQNDPKLYFTPMDLKLKPTGNNFNDNNNFVRPFYPPNHMNGLGVPYIPQQVFQKYSTMPPPQSFMQNGFFFVPEFVHPNFIQHLNNHLLISSQNPGRFPFGYVQNPVYNVHGMPQYY